MKINSRIKGKSGEREVAKLLQKFWSENQPDVQFCSTPLSGGFGNAKMRGDMKISGDLMTNAVAFPWTVEVKRREKWDLKRLQEGKRSPVWGWYKQACKACIEETKQPLLWFRKNREPWYVMLPESSPEGLTIKPKLKLQLPKNCDETVLKYAPVLVLAETFLK